MSEYELPEAGQGGTEPTAIEPSQSDALPEPLVAPLREDEMMPLYWLSNAPWVGSGYGTQTKLFAPRIAEQLGYRLAFGSFWGLKGGKIPWTAPSGKAYTVFPSWRDPHANEVTAANFKEWGGGKGFILALSDPWVFNAKIVAPLPFVAWLPIDHDPLIPATDAWLKKSRAIPIAMARFGQRIMAEAGHDALYVPHGFDANVFHPTPRNPHRKAFGIPEDAFVVGIVAANTGVPSRKCWPEMIEAFARFKKNHDDAVLYLHTELEPGGRHGVDITQLCKTKKVYPMVSDQYRYTQAYPERALAGLYNAFDVLMNGAAGEGFGVPMVEAQACGTPVICTDFSASPEVAPAEVGNWNVEGHEFWTNFHSHQYRPDIDALVDALEKAYADSAQEREDRRISVAMHALNTYEADLVTQKYWKPALEEAVRRLQFRSRQVHRPDPE
jgi:glycosyltransferase involved in cell wall biosynthesis